MTIIPLKEFPKKSRLQEKSLHLGLTLLANKLNEAGLDQKTVMEKLPAIIEVPWKLATIKELYRSFMTPLTGHTSTRDLNSKEVGEVWVYLTDLLAKEWGEDLLVPFPSYEQTQSYIESLKKS